MNHKKLDVALLKEMFEGGYSELLSQRDYVNNLNVFPVPDGDTGLNMCKTFLGGIDNSKDTSSVSSYLDDFARGTLLSARGNSGVILSQFVRGFAKGASKLSGTEISISDFGTVLSAGVEKAYGSVVNPTEGTMLTVMKDTAAFVNTKGSEYANFEGLFTDLIPAIKKSLQNTPNLLPVLKEAGVVDSGGAGILALFLGMKKVLFGEEIGKFETNDRIETSEGPSMSSRLDENAETVYGYCTEFILQLFEKKIDVEKFSIDEMIEGLQKLGDSIVAVQDEKLVKVHIHAHEPEKVLSFAHGYGEFLSLKIENMTLQHSEVLAEKGEEFLKPIEYKKYGIVAVASGKGIADYFMSLGADVIVDGGQTNNPSSEDFINAFKKLNCDHIVVLPNNSNIILAAEQAGKLYKECDVRVVATKSVAEGYSALSLMDINAPTIEALTDGMTYYLPNVTTGLVTFSTRDTSIDGIDVQEGDFIGLADKHLLAASNSKVSAALGILNAIDNIEDKEVLTVFYGKDVTTRDLDELASRVSEEFPLIEIGFINGEQDIYYFIMAIE